ncbi:MAG TPA: hypothetical protein VHB73_03360 [Alphaproteobacteria bacterium]|nr:hypothetical protein [Alphaproteobacteria bacterium]
MPFDVDTPTNLFREIILPYAYKGTVATTTLHGLAEGKKAHRIIHSAGFNDSGKEYRHFVKWGDEKTLTGANFAGQVKDIQPGPTVNFGDAGLGDGSLVAGVLTQAAEQPHLQDKPWLVNGREVVADLALQAAVNLVDPLFAHKGTVIRITNDVYARAFNNSAQPDAGHTFVLKGTTPEEVKAEVQALGPSLKQLWAEKTAVAFHREGDETAFDAVFANGAGAGVDYLTLSHAFKLQREPEFWAEKIIAPLAESLKPGGILIGTHAAGGDASEDVARLLLPETNFFPNDAHTVLDAAKAELTRKGHGAAAFSYKAHAPLEYSLKQVRPLESGAYGQDDLVNTWRALAYAGQISGYLPEHVTLNECLAATDTVLRRQNGQPRQRNNVYSIQRAPA